MANVEVPGRFFYPQWDPTIWNMNNSGLALTIDATTDYVAFVFTVPKTGVLNTVHFIQDQQTSIQDLHVSFQNVDGNNEPDGTVDQYRVFTPVGGELDVFSSPGLITSDGTDVGTKRSVTQGDRLAVVIRFDSTGGDIDIRTGATRDGTKDEMGPYAMHSANSGTTWTIHWDWLNIMLEYETLGIVHIPDTVPMLDRNTVTMNSDSTPDEVGFKFQVPFPCKVVGVVLGGPAATTVVVGIEDSAGSTIATEVDALSELPDTTTTTRRSYYFEEAEVTLEADTDYYVTWRPTTTGNQTIYNWGITDAAARGSLAWGVTSSYNTRTNGGAWSEETDKTMLMSLIISGVDDGAGGGGGSCSYGGLGNGTRIKPLAGA